MNRKQGILMGIMVAAMAIGSTASANNGAVVITEFGCSVLDQNGAAIYTTSSKSVANHGGKSTLKCSATGVANDSGRAIRFSGFACNTYMGLASKTMQVIDTEGNAMLTCQI